MLTQKEETARQRICLAVDTPTVADGLSLAMELAGNVGSFKIGKELHTAACNAGVPIVARIYENSPYKEPNVFLDLKFHDTPQTVYGAAVAATVPGVRMFNVHVAGGEKMCRKAVEGAYRAGTSAEMKGKVPYVIGVTVLTSLNDEDLAAQHLGIKYDDLVRRRTELAREWGLAGIVCPANKAGALEKEFGSDFLYVTPGIEWGGNAGEGQKQLYTPDRAIQDCHNSVLVVGSAITKAANRRATAYEILRAMAPYV
ncbi:MAG TPA: orotidine-5'-phosphate decarboxylase [archaeon]|nr:orotidine-5'-phosphate decarboxylase [archaeon]